MNKHKNYLDHSFSLQITQNEKGKHLINGESTARWRNFFRYLRNSVCTDGYMEGKRQLTIEFSALLRRVPEKKQVKIAKRIGENHYNGAFEGKKDTTQAVLESGKVTSPAAYKLLRLFAGLPPLDDA